ncbi:unnamed protein product [Urochloa humidicola]
MAPCFILQCARRCFLPACWDGHGSKEKAVPAAVTRKVQEIRRGGYGRICLWREQKGSESLAGGGRKDERKRQKRPVAAGDNPMSPEQPRLIVTKLDGAKFSKKKKKDGTRSGL